MEETYPNEYYAELAVRIIKNPKLKLRAEEVCFYQGKASSFKSITTTTKGKPQGGKTSVVVTPWFFGVKRSAKEVKVTTETKTQHYTGNLFITNMRIVFHCSVDGFDELFTKIKTVKKYTDGLEVFVGKKSYKIKTTDVQQVMKVIDLINKAQSTPVHDSQQSDSVKQLHNEQIEKEYIVKYYDKDINISTIWKQCNDKTKAVKQIHKAYGTSIQVAEKMIDDFLTSRS